MLTQTAHPSLEVRGQWLLGRSGYGDRAVVSCGSHCLVFFHIGEQPWGSPAPQIPSVCCGHMWNSHPTSWPWLSRLPSAPKACVPSAWWEKRGGPHGPEFLLFFPESRPCLGPGAAAALGGPSLKQLSRAGGPGSHQEGGPGLRLRNDAEAPRDRLSQGQQRWPLPQPKPDF